MKKMYLSGILKGKKFENNTFIVSPCGSGKTHFIYEDLFNDESKKYLYLCDNENLKISVVSSNQETTRDGKIQELRNFKNVIAMCYKQFGEKVRYTNDYIKNFDIIVCDEIHNLVDYQCFRDDADLSHAIKELFKTYENTKIFYFTATPFYIDELQNKKNVDFSNITRLDFTKSKEIKRYVSLVTDYFSSYQQIPTILNNNRDNFEFNGRKALIYTNQIETMKTIAKSIEDDIFKPICIWSRKQEGKPMNEEQINVLNHLITTGELLEPYNVLLINRATETGLNITDKNMLYCIINTTNVTQQIQARGRLRHDIVELKLKADKKVVQRNIYDIEEFLDRNLTKEDKDSLCEKLNLFDNKGRLLKWTRVKNLLIEQSYKIEDKKIRIEGKQVKISIIRK
ncbi:DEAD/DEAH box helicase family protein [Clostridium perfringens]|uniref:DEAD/DEAH box helicase family protein n=1 Tax=Clostridium perfringens TaxID=1502 RepID=UPI001DFCB85D|nr:DEAD/DEAH box helicase family protein [Clostridium perfringens]EIF6167616.1 DEAD/DEAH box helicase family protein [Clostridium perfringens]ELC8395807.1 DEAD/DEAH box helicase family protein [Clostridium perfringens]MDM0635099.1 DEAD/DEAH box helicase family protein [Clostridium perfringens]